MTITVYFLQAQWQAQIHQHATTTQIRNLLLSSPVMLPALKSAHAADAKQTDAFLAFLGA